MNRVLGATMTVNVGAGIVGGAVIVLCAPWIAGLFRLEPGQVPLVVRLLRYAGLAFVLAPPAGALQAVPEALQRHDVSSKVRIGMFIVQGAAMTALVALGYGLTGLVLWMVASSVLKLFLHAWVALKLVPGIDPRPRPSREGLKEVFGYGLFAFLNQWIGKIALYIDRPLLGMFFGMAEVTYLSVPKDVLTRGADVYVAAGRALFPRFSAMNEGTRMRELFLNSTWSLFCMSLALFVPTTIIMPEFLRLWMGEAFARESATVSQIIAASMTLRGAFVPYFGLLKGTGRVHWLTVVYVLTTAVGIAAAVVLVPLFGVIGAGYRMWVVVWAGFLFILYICRKLFPEVSLRTVGITLLLTPCLVSLVCGAAFWHVWKVLAPTGWAAMIIAWVVMALVLSAALWGSNRLLAGPQGAAAQVRASALAFLSSMRRTASAGDEP
jgi:O-antigen/teichoic acid export membrane protein